MTKKERKKERKNEIEKKERNWWNWKERKKERKKEEFIQNEENKLD